MVQNDSIMLFENLVCLILRDKFLRNVMTKRRVLHLKEQYKKQITEVGLFGDLVDTNLLVRALNFQLQSSFILAETVPIMQDF